MNVIDEAKKEFEVFNRLYQKVERLWKRGIAVRPGYQVLHAISFFEGSISLTQDWVEKYKSHIQEVNLVTEKIGEADDWKDWKEMLEEIRNKLRHFRILLISQKVDESLLEKTDQIIAKIVELLENHIYPPKV